LPRLLGKIREPVRVTNNNRKRSSHPWEGLFSRYLLAVTVLYKTIKTKIFVVSFVFDQIAPNKKNLCRHKQNLHHLLKVDDELLIYV